MENMKRLSLNDLDGVSGGTLTEEQITSFTIVAEFNKKIKFDDLCMMYGITDPDLPPATFPDH